MPEIENKEVEIRSDEVQEILSHTPNWMIRWGITSIFFMILILVGISYFVKYPDVIKGEITLTTKIPPVKLVSKTNGNISTIYVNEGDTVKENDFIVDIESPLNDSAVIYLKKLVISTQFAINNPKSVEINFKENSLVFGEIQVEYSRLKKTYHEYYQFITDSYRNKKILSLRQQISNYNKLATISYRQLKFTKHDLKNGKEKFLSEQKLFEKGIISKIEYFDKQTSLNQSKQQVENIKKTYIQNQITITDYKKQLDELEHTTIEKERVLKENIEISCNTIQNYLNTWKQNYRISSPFDGRVSYLGSLNENQFVNAGTNLFAIIPNNNEYLGMVQIPTQGFGKVKVGQIVYIKLNNYPYNEFGQLEGVIKEISLVPSIIGEQKQSIYLAKVSLTNGLETTYKRKLEFSPEMTGNAEIITEDLRLIDRIFNQFRKLMDK